MSGSRAGADTRRTAAKRLGAAELLKLLARGLSITEIAREKGIARADLARELRRIAGEIEARGQEHATAGDLFDGAGAGDGPGQHGVDVSGSRLVIYSDGASRGNPGPAAIGIVVLKDGKVLAEKGQPIGKATNNVAEYRAVLAALAMARTYGAREIEIRMDSELVLRQITGQYRVKDPRLAELAREVGELVGGFDAISWRHVPRSENARADALANHALDRGLSP